MDLTERAREVFSQDAFASLTGIEIVSAGEHCSQCSLKLERRHLNARAVAMGGVLYTLADLAAAVASNSDCLDGDLQWVSLVSTAHYLYPAFVSTLIADCKAVKHGRSTALYRTEITSLNNGKLLAVVETTMSHI